MVADGARLGSGVEIGAYSIVGARVSVGDGTTVGAHVIIAGETTIGRDNRLFPFSSIGDIPQDRKYDGAATRTVIGDANVVREFVSINAGTAQDRGVTTIGNGNWLLAYSHIAHDCVIGNGTTFSNNAQLAGHVQEEDYAVLGGFVGVHQFCRVGAHAMVAAGSIAVFRQTISPPSSAPIGACIAASSRSTMRSSRSPPTRNGCRRWNCLWRSWKVPAEGLSVDGRERRGRGSIGAADDRHCRR